MRVPAKTFALVAAGTVVAANGSFDSVITDFDQFINTFVVEVTVTAVSGTSPTLDLYLQTTIDNGTTFRDVVHFTQLTAITTANQGVYVVVSPGNAPGLKGSIGDATVSAGQVGLGTLLNQLIRVKAVVGGTTPSFTIGVNAYYN